MTDKSLIEAEIEKTKRNIKKLTKVTIKTCAPLKERESELVGFCSELTRDIEKSKYQLKNDPESNYHEDLNKQLTRCFTEFGKITGTNASYIESLYTDFIK